MWIFKETQNGLWTCADGLLSIFLSLAYLPLSAFNWPLATHVCLYILTALCFLLHAMRADWVPGCDLVWKRNHIEKGGRESETLCRHAMEKVFLSLMSQALNDVTWVCLLAFISSGSKHGVIMHLCS